MGEFQLTRGVGGTHFDGRGAGQAAFSSNLNLPPRLIPPPPNLPQVTPPPGFGQGIKPTSINAGANMECIVQ